MTRLLARAPFAVLALGLVAANANACAIGSGSDLATNQVAGFPDAEESGRGDASTDARAPSSGTDAGAPDAWTVTGESDAGACAKLAASDACGVLAQCGCAAGQTCDLVGGVATCVASGTKAAAAACASTSECQRGLSCRGGACRPFCETAASCGGTGLGACSTTIEGASVKACAVACELQTPTGACGTGTCAWTGAATDCRPAGAKANGASCAATSECGQGLACAPTIFGNMCLKWCRIGAGECPGFGLCTSVFGASAPKVGNVEYGVCP